MNSFAAFDMNCFHKLLAMLSLQVDEVSLLTTPSYDWEASVVNRPHSDITYWGDRRAHGIFRKWESLIKLMRFHILDTFTKGYNVIWFYHRPGFDSSYNSLTEVKDSTNVKICRKIKTVFKLSNTITLYFFQIFCLSLKVTHDIPASSALFWVSWGHFILWWIQ